MKKYILVLFLGLAISIGYLSASAEQSDLNNQLIRSIEKRESYATIERLLQRGASANATAPSGKTALMFATAGLIGSHGIARLLLEKGANPNATDNKGRTALMNTAHASDEDDVRLLLQAGADANAVDHDGDTVLMQADDFETVMLLLEAGANPNIANNQGQTALAKAIKFAQWLEKSDSQSLPYHEKIVLKNKKLTELLQQKTDPNLQAMQSSAANQKLKQLNIAEQHDLNSQLIQSIEERKSYATIERLLQRGASANTTAPSGKTALMFATASLAGSHGIVRLLLERGANPNATDNKARTALMNAAYLTDEDNVKLLLQAGADVNPPDSNGDTALIKTNDFETAMLLLQAGANPNITNNQGQTALAKAIKMAQHLENADRSKLDGFMSNQERKMMLSGYKKLIELLQQKTDPNLQTTQNSTVNQRLKQVNIFDEMENGVR